MKKLMIMLAFVCLFAVLSPVTQVFAADAQPNNVTITVVLPGQAPELPEEPIPTPVPVPVINMYPVDVREVRENGGRQIIKVYELTALENPANIPRESFERSGWMYTLTDILKRETANAETRAHTETVTLNTDTKELAQILGLLAPTIEYTSEDDFVGLLYLDVSSIKVETAGTRTTSHTMTVTREYPRLSSTDTSNVPKTVTDRGTTYHLASVDWKVGNYSTVDYTQIADYYTAVATYTATGTTTRVTGYVTTAEYTGTLARLSQGKTIYTAFFLGEEIRTPLEITELPKAEPPVEEPCDTEPESAEEPAEEAPADEPEQETDGENKSGFAWFVIIPCLGILAGGAYYFIKLGKGKKHNEKTHNSDSVADDDGGDNCSCSGG